MTKAMVLEASSNVFTLFLNGEIVQAKSRGKLRIDKVVAGDVVEADKDKDGNYVIEKINPRKNLLIRPNIANVDQLLIVIARTPTPDFNLVDRQIVIAGINKIRPLLVINKQDIMDDEFYNKINAQYKGVVDMVYCSATTGDIGALVANLRRKISVLSGQSAVGKSSLINAIFKTSVKVGTFSAKLDRGKHTTKGTRFYINEDIILADSAGFSCLTPELDYRGLKSYFPEFNNSGCKYANCSHVDEEPCKVKEKVNKGKINRDRYDRYVTWYKELKEQYNKRYK